jgi:hypothetical protein
MMFSAVASFPLLFPANRDIRQVGRGKFRIIEGSNGKLSVDSIVDASDILNCRAQK